MPPTPVRELLAASGATLYVLATDANLVATIRRAVGDRHPLFVVESWAELRDAAESGRCGIALLDAAVLGPRVTGCVSSLAAHADRLVTLVAAERSAAQEYFGLLSDGRLHRLLIKPAAVGAARLLIESATARRLQLREESANDGTPNVAVAAPSKRAKWVWAVAAGVSAVALLGTAVVGSRLGWWDRAGAVDAVVAPATAAATAPATVPTPTERLSDLRASAALAFQEGRLAEPARRQRARSLSRDSCAGPFGPSRSRRLFVRAGRVVHACRGSAAHRLARDRRCGARSRPARRSREQSARVPPGTARARVDSAAASGARWRGAAARGRCVHRARDRAEPCHGPIAPRAALEPQRR